MTLQRHRVTQLLVRGRTKSRSSTSSHAHARCTPGGRQARTGQGRHPMPPPAERSNSPRRCGARREGMKNRPLQAEEGRTGVKHQQRDRQTTQAHKVRTQQERYMGQRLGRGPSVCGFLVHTDFSHLFPKTPPGCWSTIRALFCSHVTL